MADLTPINVGQAPMDGTGDKARVAFQKVNDNFDTLNTELGSAQETLAEIAQRGVVFPTKAAAIEGVIPNDATAIMVLGVVEPGDIAQPLIYAEDATERLALPAVARFKSKMLRNFSLRADEAQIDAFRYAGSDFDWSDAWDDLVQYFANDGAGKGGSARFGRRVYDFGRGLVVPEYATSLTGCGTASKGLPSNWRTSPTQLVFHNTTGDAIRFLSEAGRISHMRVHAGSSRAARPFDPETCGIRWEQLDDDDPAIHTGYAFAENVFVTAQPGHGFAGIANSFQALWTYCSSVKNKGHAYALDRGNHTNRDDMNERPGATRIIGSRGHDCGGHAVACAHPDSENMIPYRFELSNFECYRCASDPAVRFKPATLYIATSNGYVDDCGIGGSLIANDIDGLWIAATSFAVRNNRYIVVDTPVVIGRHPGFQSDGIEVIAGTVSGGPDELRPYFARTEADTGDITIKLPTTANVAALMDDASISRCASFVGQFGRPLEHPFRTVGTTRNLDASFFGSTVRTNATDGPVSLTIPPADNQQEGATITARKTDLSANKVSLRYSGQTGNLAELNHQADEVEFWVQAGAWYLKRRNIQPLVVRAAASGSLAKPPLATRLVVRFRGGSGGGGSGARYAEGSVRGGGAGGSGATVNELDIPADQLPSTIPFTVGAAGVGGAAQTTDSSNGNAGTAGGTSSFGNSGADYYAVALGGLGGAGGIQTTNTPTAPTTLSRVTGVGGTPSATGLVGGSGGSGFAPGGGAGGGRSAANVPANGGAGRDRRGIALAGGVAPGGTGTNGVAAPDGAGFTPGASGGGGGAGSDTIPGGAGGNGADGGGGAGGGSSANGQPSGKGGDGSPGFFEFTWHFGT